VNGLTELEGIYRAEYGNLVRSLTLLAGSREVAADAVQDAFVTAGVRWREVSTMVHPVGWIRTVAARKLLDGHRRSARWRRLVPVIGRRADHPDEAEVVATDQALTAALEHLPRRQRAAVVLHYLADWPVADVAAALGVAPGTVKSTLSDARAALRAQLTEGASDA
jgi:RNA polymerase sigma-70 factor (ECF subfamily)